MDVRSLLLVAFLGFVAARAASVRSRGIGACQLWPGTVFG